MWYRDQPEPDLRRSTAGFAEFAIPDPLDAAQARLVRVDLATAAVEERLPRLSTAGGWLAGDIYLLMEPRESVARPDVSEHVSSYLHDLTFADARTKLYTPIAEAVPSVRWLPDQGLVYLDAHGPDPGVWVVPLPPA